MEWSRLFFHLTGKLILLIALCSNNILILNEETVVALCFISFIVFSFSSVASALSEAVAERNQNIAKEILSELQNVKQHYVQGVEKQVYVDLISKQNQLLVQALKRKEAVLSHYNDVLPKYNSDLRSQVLQYQSLQNLKNFAKARASILSSLFFNKVVNGRLSK
jgi:hypothetical protein